MTKLYCGQELKQSLKINAAMQQSINMLQMSTTELQSVIAQELASNPFLEENISSTEHETQFIFEKNSNRPKTRASDADYDYLSNIVAEKTLHEHVLEQIAYKITDHKERLIAYHLLDSLGADGYVSFDIVNLSKILQCNFNLIENVLLKLQTLDPIGIFARNLQECLLIQLKAQSADSEHIIKLIDNLALLAKNDLKSLQKLCKVNNVTLQKMITIIKKLHPKPANGFSTEQTMFRVPDVIVAIDTDGIITMTVNSNMLPQICINNELLHKVKANIHSQTDKLFVKQELNSATNIIKFIEQRSKTLMKVASCIVEEQKEFFLKGIMYLKPLILSRIAELTGLNESTVSRATANKYIATPTGIYELKYFFSSSVTGVRSMSGNVSSTKVKELIRQVILNEDYNCVLSDDEIAKELLKFNISIARRTVAKYRQSLGILTSSLRKQQHRVQNF